MAALTAVDSEQHATAVASRRHRAVLIGNPNTGKTTIFNRLCGARAKTSNFPGTTTSTRTGRTELAAQRAVEVLDIPGVYELHLDAAESKIAREVLGGDSRIGPAAGV